MKRQFFSIAIITVFSLAVSGVAYAAMTSTGGFQIWADVISVGGIEESVSGGGFIISDTVGEGVIGQSTSSSGSLKAGFQEMVKDILTLSVAPASIDLGTLSPSAAATASHTLTINTNSATGLTVNFSGNTLESGANQIAAIGTLATTSHPGNSQFGFNAIRTSGSASNSLSPYNVAGSYAFNDGDNIISAAGPLPGAESYNVNYLANISSSQDDGSYSTTITYTALANF